MLIELGVQKGIIIQGMEGSEDLAVDRKTRTYLVHDGTSELFIIDPELLELDADCPEKKSGPHRSRQPLRCRSSAGKRRRLL